MAYQKKTWVSDETPLSAENMNHIEQGIQDNDDLLELMKKSSFFYLGQGDGYIETGNYDEWIKAGKPVIPVDESEVST